MTLAQPSSVSAEIAGDPDGTPQVMARVEGVSFRLHFARGSGVAHPLYRLPHYKRFYRRMSRMHTHPSYKAIADALDRLAENL
ncbi:hypothetical protein SAMN05444339_1125 [Loktanella atrilutea]|uniref:Uncharacterized protein n=1 Tax=Loktanella atrilutea TaxID=366533 RepID=A0A1M5E9C3_LOKAT|nr:hypothetical protein [Loktanella atrilutea]SHF75848.1 hypothetical protein SAMN05444339_1125 [Loktanella atrilutea]